MVELFRSYRIREAFIRLYIVQLSYYRVSVRVFVLEH